ncbi:MAG TPA: hypothetical protein VNP95_02080 [Thermomicrobiales bacterium]|nr:hypothetical protein [Thermomicrobiales bacterium]
MSTADDSDEQTPPGVTGIRRVPPIAPRPVNDRHILMRLPKRTYFDDRNTVVLPGVDIGEDFRAIGRGHGWYNASRRETWVNGRLYGQHANGTLFPIRGEGFVEMDRQEYKALLAIRRYNGDMALALRELRSDPHISGEQQETAIRLWTIRQQAKRELP